MRIKYEAIDIFSGCGGVSCGLSLAGFKIKSAVEIEKHAVDTYLNYEPLSKVNVLNEDICKLSGEKILKAAKIKKDDIYMFAGCPPCQNFSRQNPLNKNKTEEERKKRMSYITEQMIVIAKRVEAKKQQRQKKRLHTQRPYSYGSICV